MTEIIRPALRKSLISLAAAFVLAFVGTAPASAQQLQVRATVDLNGRAGPGPEYAVLFVIPQNAILTVLQCTQDYGWCNVALGSQTAWAAGRYLEVVQTNQPIPDAGPQLGPVFDFLLGVLGPQFGLPQLPPAPPPTPAPQPQPQPQPQPPQLPTPDANEVCFYRDINFGGDAFCVNMGASNTNLIGAWNNAISSIRVGQNASVQVCGDPNFGGWCQTYVDDVNLTGTRNDSISSYRTVDAGAPASGPTPPTLAAYPVVNLNARTGPGTGNPVAFVVPQDRTVQIIQCVQDFSWCQLTYQGQTAWASAQYLRASQSGLLISQAGAQLGIPIANQPAPQPQPQPQPPATPTPGANEVCFYLNDNFTGDAFCVSTGRANFSLSGQWNNAISSIRVGANASVVVCGDPNLAGWCQTYTDNVNLTSFRNNAISSYRTLAANTPSPSARVCFFENANFGGASFCVDAGQSYALMPTGWDNRITSIRVEPGYSVQVCRDTNFGGWCEEITADVPQLFGDRNNAISSVRTQ